MMKMAKLEDKFIVINRKNLVAFTDYERRAFFNLLLKISNNNRYYVCNQDEPYAQEVIDTILGGEDKKEA